MLRAHRKSYIPCWNEKYNKLLLEFENSRNEITANKSTAFLDEEKRKKQSSAMDEIDLTNSNKKRLDLTKEIGNCLPSVK